MRPAAVVKSRRRLERLAGGKDLHKTLAGAFYDATDAPTIERQCIKEKARLDSLLVMAEGRDQAIADNRKAEAAIRDLLGQADKLRSECLDPANMAWSK